MGVTSTEDRNFGGCCEPALRDDGSASVVSGDASGSASVVSGDASVSAVDISASAAARTIAARGAPPPLALTRRLRASFGPQALARRAIIGLTTRGTPAARGPGDTRPRRL